MFESVQIDLATIAAAAAGSKLADLDAAATVTAFELNEHTLIQAELRRLELAAHWADLHPGAAVDPRPLPGRERPVQTGGDGTPEVGSFAAADLGPVLASTAGSASRLMADALDLRHRLPRTWVVCRSGRVPVYQARRVATLTRHLSREQARQVDARVAPALGTISLGRLQSLVEGLICEADPEAAERAADQAARDRFVRLGRDTEHGLRTIWAKVTAGDALWGNAVITRIAEILRRDGDCDSLEVRRSKAFGVLISQPGEALRLLHTHQDDDDDDPEQSPEPEEPGERDEDDGATAGEGDRDGALRQAQGTEDGAQGTESDGATAGERDPNGALRQAQGTNTETDAGSRSLRIGPPPFDPAKARPRAILYVHLSEAALSASRGVARVEDVGPVVLSRLSQLLGDRCQILLKPVIDLNDTPAPVDCYDIPAVIAEHLRLRQPFDVFPYAAGASRRADLDHSIAYLPLDHGGPPGQTGVEELGPLVRYHHMVKTQGRWRLRQPEPGVYLWRSPHRRIFLVNATGTHPLGRGSFARQIWRAAKAPPKPKTAGCPADPSSSGHDTTGSGHGSTSSGHGPVERALQGLSDAHTLGS